MPELPDVEVFRRYLDSTALHTTIQDVHVADATVLENISADGLRRGLRFRTMEETRRHGKYCAVRLDNEEWLIMHFGMTGLLRFFKDDAHQPGHARILFRLHNGTTLAYVSRRKLGSVTLARHWKGFIDHAGLGPDALELDRRGFIAALSGSGAMVKSALMRQQNLAGIGNIYSDEILFQSGVHPRSGVRNLEQRVLDALYRNMRGVLVTAIDRQADPQKLPADFLIPERHEQGRCPKCKAHVLKMSMATLIEPPMATLMEPL